MTLIIGVITQEYILIASDRRVTFINSSDKNFVKDDNRCKLVSLCNTSVIGFTGLAEVNGTKTHEWLLQVLAEADCKDAKDAVFTIAERATQHFTLLPKAVPQIMRRHLFLLVGWSFFDGLEGVTPHFCVISNALDDNGKWLQVPNHEFSYRARALRGEESFLWYSAGAMLSTQQRKELERNIRRLVKREMGPTGALKILSEEIVETSKRNRTVGTKVLAACIPKNSITRQINTGHSQMINDEPGLHTAAFTYYDKDSSDIRSYGPSIVCGGTAFTDIETEDDPSRSYQSSSGRIVSLPKKQSGN